MILNKLLSECDDFKENVDAIDAVELDDDESMPIVVCRGISSVSSSDSFTCRIDRSSLVLCVKKVSHLRVRNKTEL